MSRFQSVALKPRERDTRNTQDEFRCRDCHGTGAYCIEIGNPYREDYVACRPCYGTGWVRWRSADVLVRLKFAREIRFQPHYDQLRQRAMAPVRLED